MRETRSARDKVVEEEEEEGMEAARDVEASGLDGRLEAPAVEGFLAKMIGGAS